MNISGASSFTLSENSEIMTIINQKADPEVNIKVGAWQDEGMGDAISVTLVATGFPSSNFLDYANNDNKNLKQNPHGNDKIGSSLGDFVTSREFSQMKTRQPVLSGLEKRNATQKTLDLHDEVAEPEKRFSAKSLNVTLPPDDIDLDVPTFLRQGR